MERSAVGALCRPAGVGTRHRAKAVDREGFWGSRAQKRLVVQARPHATSLRRSTQPSRHPDKYGASMQAQPSTDVYISMHLLPPQHPVGPRRQQSQRPKASLPFIAAHAPESTLAW